MVTRILNLLFLICNDSLSVIGPTRVTVSPLDALPAMGPNRGDSQHGDGAARSIEFWFRSVEAHSSLEGGFIIVERTMLRLPCSLLWMGVKLRCFGDHCQRGRSTIEARSGKHMGEASDKN